MAFRFAIAASSNLLNIINAHYLRQKLARNNAYWQSWMDYCSQLSQMASGESWDLDIVSQNVSYKTNY